MLKAKCPIIDDLEADNCTLAPRHPINDKEKILWIESEVTGICKFCHIVNIMPVPKNEDKK